MARVGVGILSATVDETETSDPSKRSYYERAEWHGMIYKDGEGQERCPSQWHFPCRYCHKKKQPTEIAAAERSRAPKPVELTEDQQSNMEREALEAHERDDPPAEQYVYTRG